jgi:hypothetical protein
MCAFEAKKMLWFCFARGMAGNEIFLGGQLVNEIASTLAEGPPSVSMGVKIVSVPHEELFFNHSLSAQRCMHGL